IGMLVMSKNITSRRRSLYFTSPGLAGAIWLEVTDFTTGAAGAAGAGGSGGSVRRFGRGRGRGSFDRRHGLRRRRGLFQFLIGEDLDVLFLAVFGDVEVGRLETSDRVSALVLHRDVHHHQLGGSGELEAAFGRGGRRRLRSPWRLRRHCRNYQQAAQECGENGSHSLEIFPSNRIGRSSAPP